MKWVLFIANVAAAASIYSCSNTGKSAIPILAKKDSSLAAPAVHPFKGNTTTIHVLVALCDNKYQGIIPVPQLIGNGQDPDNNLYWGCSAGIRSYFKKSSNWVLLKRIKMDSIKMERLIYKYKKKNYYLVADAYNGKYIKNCCQDFFNSCSGSINDSLQINGTTIGTYGNAKLICYIGHDGLMDFNLNKNFNNRDGQIRDAIVLACISKKFFSPLLLQTKARPILWTTGLMCPEAYTLHDALDKYINGAPIQNLRTAAARAYAKYQKCSEKAAENLLVTGY